MLLGPVSEAGVHCFSLQQFRCTIAFHWLLIWGHLSALPFFALSFLRPWVTSGGARSATVSQTFHRCPACSSNIQTSLACQEWACLYFPYFYLSILLRQSCPPRMILPTTHLARSKQRTRRIFLHADGLFSSHYAFFWRSLFLVYCSATFALMNLVSVISKTPDAWHLLRFCHFMREKACHTFCLLSFRFPLPSALIYPTRTNMTNWDLPCVTVLYSWLFVAWLYAKGPFLWVLSLASAASDQASKI